MSGYNYNLYNGGGIPDQGNNGLPLVIADANLPTQAVSASPVGQGTTLSYSPFVVESNLSTPANKLPAEKTAQKFQPTKQPAQPKLWTSVWNAVVKGQIKTGASYAATGDYSSAGASAQGGNTGSASTGMVSTGGTGSVNRSNSV